LRWKAKKLHSRTSSGRSNCKINGTNYAERRKATGGRNPVASGYKKVTKIQLFSTNKRKHGRFLRL
jgi:hypothetical protein